MEDLKARLEQVVKDRNIQLGALEDMDNEVEDIKKQIADSEDTYSVGDRFTGNSTARKYMLVEVYCSKIALIRLDTGECFGGGKQTIVHCIEEISQIEMGDIKDGGSFTRYWDNRKQCKV